jgi:hypothetical protein
MRKLTKEPVPQVLAANRAAWTLEYVGAVENGKAPPARWGHDEIRQSLQYETLEKCAYCESYVGHVAFPNVEHIVPRAYDPSLVYSWGNLTTACPRCNTYKSDFYNPSHPLLNPYVDEPADHVLFLGPWLTHVYPDGRGRLTIEILRLSRLDLCNSRLRRLEKVRMAVDEWRQSESPLREALASAIHLDAAEGEYSACVLAFLEQVGFSATSST